MEVGLQEGTEVQLDDEGVSTTHGGFQEDGGMGDFVSGFGNVLNESIPTPTERSFFTLGNCVPLDLSFGGTTKRSISAVITSRSGSSSSGCSMSSRLSVFGLCGGKFGQGVRDG